MTMNVINKPASSLVFLCFLVLLQGCKPEEPQTQQTIRPVTIHKIQIKDNETRSFTGKARPVQQVDLAFRVSGPLYQFPVSVGDKVTQGQVVAKIDPSPFIHRVKLLEAKLLQAQSDLDYHSKEYQRALDIQSKDTQLISDGELDKRQRDKQSAASNVQAIAAELGIARDNLEYTELRAPFTGEISRTYVENYEGVAPGIPVVRIIDISQIEMTVDLPEQLIHQVSEVSKIEVQFDALSNQVLTASVKEYSAEADRITGTFPVTLLMTQPQEAQILPGMSGKATGSRLINTSDTSVFIPLGAVGRNARSETYVWRYQPESQKIQKVLVTTQALTHQGVYVSGGLAQGDAIVSAGIYDLVEGQQVTPLGRGDF